MKKGIIFFTLLIFTANFVAQNKPDTFCNPLNLNYNFTSVSMSHRTAADPVITLYKDNYANQ